MSGRFPNEAPVLSGPTSYSRIRKRILAAAVNDDNGEERVKRIQPNWIGLSFCLALLLIGSPSIALSEQPPAALAAQLGLHGAQAVIHRASSTT